MAHDEVRQGKQFSGDEAAFEASCAREIERMASDEGLQRLGRELTLASEPFGYSYHFRWLGRPIIQCPQDIVALQEIIWSVRPEIIVETGVARGGSSVFFASLLHLLGGEGKVVAVDIDIRPHNRRAIESHPMSDRIVLIEGSSVEDLTVARIFDQCRGKRAVVVLDSNHTHDHVLQELNLYSPLVRVGSYMVVFDTIVEDFPPGYYADRPWDRGNNPKTAVTEFLRTNRRFEVDHRISAKLLVSLAPGGYLRCVQDP